MNGLIFAYFISVSMAHRNKQNKKLNAVGNLFN